MIKSGYQIRYFHNSQINYKIKKIIHEALSRTIDFLIVEFLWY